MKNQEIERKYFLNYIPKDIKILKVQNIVQSYLYRDKITTIRVRKINDLEYIYTVKTKGDIEKDNSKIANKYELERNISKEEYENLEVKRISNRINKKRIVVPIQNKLKVEIDIYYDYLKGFLTAEVEFPNEEMANNFKKPKWIGEEIGYKEFSNGKLSEMSEQEFKSKVPKEIIEKNKEIIAKLT